MSFFAPHRAFAREVLPAVAIVLGVLVARPGVAQELTTPEAFFGHPIGADYELPDYGGSHPLLGDAGCRVRA